MALLNKISFIQYKEEPFSLQNTLCLVRNKCLFFIFRKICCSESIGKDWFKLKISVKFLSFQNSILGLEFEYIWYKMSFKKNAWWVKPYLPPGGTLCPPPPTLTRWFSNHCIFTSSSLKLILYDFFSNFIFNMWPVTFFWLVK